MNTSHRQQAIDGSSLKRRGAVVGFAWLTLAAGATAQTAADMNFNPPDIRVVDEAGVNLISGNVISDLSLLSIGPADRPLTLQLQFDGPARFPTASATLYGGLRQVEFLAPTQPPTGEEHITVTLLGSTEKFRKSNGLWTSDHGGMLTQQGVDQFQYTRKDGALATFHSALRVDKCPNVSKYGHSVNGYCQALSKIVLANGLEYEFFYQGANPAYLHSVSRNDGYQLRFTYGTNGAVNGAVGINSAIQYCDPSATPCSLSQSWPSAQYSYQQTSGDSITGTGNHTFVDSGGVTHRFTNSWGWTGSASGATWWGTVLLSKKSGTSASADTSSFTYFAPNYCYDSGDNAWECTAIRPPHVSYAYRGSSTWNYSFVQEAPHAPAHSGARGLWRSTAVAPGGFTTTTNHWLTHSTIEWVNASNGYLGYQGQANRVVSARDVDGKNFSFVYDSRGNVTTKTQVHSSDGNQNLVYSADFDIACVYLAKCNKPNWVRDAKGSQTDYVYDPAHGGPTRVLRPADASGVRPVTRYTYTSRYAWIKNSSGAFVRAATPIVMLTEERACVDGPTKSDFTGCVSGREVVTTYDYGPDAGPSNLLLRGKSVASEGLTLRTCFGYDAVGNKVSETTPRAALAACP